MLLEMLRAATHGVLIVRLPRHCAGPSGSVGQSACSQKLVSCAFSPRRRRRLARKTKIDDGDRPPERSPHLCLFFFTALIVPELMMPSDSKYQHLVLFSCASDEKSRGNRVGCRCHSRLAAVASVVASPPTRKLCAAADARRRRHNNLAERRKAAPFPAFLRACIWRRVNWRSHDFARRRPTSLDVAFRGRRRCRRHRRLIDCSLNAASTHVTP